MATSPAPDDPPLSIEPVLGWRVWRLHRRDGALTLVSVTRPDSWPAGEVMEATCVHHRGPDTPSKTCSCGLYAAASPEDLARSGVFQPDACVVGAIAMWGTVVEHTVGARSRFAYPARLRLVCGACLASGAGGVDPTWVITAETGLRAVCTMHHPASMGGPIRAARVQTELLDTYGVELLPTEGMDLKPAARIATAAPDWARPLVRLALLIGTVVRLLVGGLFMLWAVSGMLILAFAIVAGVVQAGIHALGFGGDDPAPTPVLVATPAPPVAIPPANDLPARGALPPPPPPFAFVCALDEGGRVQIIPCDEPADLAGLTTHAPPSGPATDCTPGWTAYSRGAHYSICWIDMRPNPVQRGIRAPNAWSIPVRQGGAA